MSISEWIDKGGIIMYILIFMNVLGWTIMAWKSFRLYQLSQSKTKQQEVSTIMKQLDFEKYDIKDYQKLEYSVSYFMDPYHHGLSTIRIIATIAPLLGLLGTVIGILSSFQTIAQSGLDNPSLFADGISLALVTTVAGLIVSIPHYIAYNYFSSHLDKMEKTLEKDCLSMGS